MNPLTPTLSPESGGEGVSPLRPAIRHHLISAMMYSSGRRLSMSVAALLLALCALPHFSAAEEIVDYGQFEPKTTEQRVVPGYLDLTSQARELWRGRAETLQVRTGILKNGVVWVVADRTHVHVSFGMQAAFYPADLNVRARGRIVTIDLQIFDPASTQAWITVVHFFGKELMTTMYSLSERDGGWAIDEYESFNAQAVRAIHNGLYSQHWSRSGRWRQFVERLAPDERGRFERAEKIDVAGGTLLISMVFLPDGSAAQVTDNGDLLISRGRDIDDRRVGAYGARADHLGKYGDPREAMRNAEMVRLRPAFMAGRDWVAVADNPVQKNFLRGLMYSGQVASVRLFKLEKGRLKEAGMIGPYNGPILDLVVPPSNPNQLIWTRKTAEGDAVLEMVDLESIGEAVGREQ